LPAFAVMGIIFWFSSQPSDQFINFGLLDWAVKKIGHVIGYGLLALSFWFGFDFQSNRRWATWCLALVYAITDEFHQSFVPGRHPSIWDVVIFDQLGILIGLWIAQRWLNKNDQPLTADR
jgi:VanZ family protein